MQTCLYCKDEFMGRSDKKFCSDGCRNAYNNNQNKDSTNLMRNVNNKLRKNHRILVGLNSKEDFKTKIPKSKLVSAGFDFQYFTQLITYKNGNSYQFIYDQGYRFLDDDWILLVKKE